MCAVLRCNLAPCAVAASDKDKFIPVRSIIFFVKPLLLLGEEDGAQTEGRRRISPQDLIKEWCKKSAAKPGLAVCVCVCVCERERERERERVSE